ncbi:gamma-aminobutyric acid receptor subunit epsilon-like isoform X2 [Convolutriloba macropyga]|uniref:gamma-aminobutyric acid receptor subunit epsilon-like isoform X2 n=1 Tax=Convolutriloba macropyga TaxID=536237 RepID=UPI003F52561F
MDAFSHQSIRSDGLVIVKTTSMTIHMSCHLNLLRFPFDKQECPIRATQWTSNQSSFRIINPELDFNEAEPFGLYEQQTSD